MRLLLAAFLSFVWPGLGQAYLGQRRRGLVQALPVAVPVALAAAAIVWLGPLVAAAYLFNPVVALALIVLVVALAAWRAWSVIDALDDPTPLIGRPTHALGAAVLIAVVILSHGWIGWTAFSFLRAGQQINQPVAGLTQPDEGSPTPKAQTTASPTSAPELPGTSQRVTILFVGLDNTHGPLRALTDTLIVASFDPRTNSLAMISLPRDTARLPYYDGGQWDSRINVLMQAAVRSPDDFPDGPMATLVNEMSYLVGIPIDYYAVIGITGFSQLVDSVGGIDIVAPGPIADAGYQFSPTEIGFFLDAGAHHLDGKYATAYARSRHGSSDYARAARQQQVLLALRDRLEDPFVLANLSGLLDAVAQIVRTDAPIDRLPEIVAIVQRSGRAGTEHVVLAPPDYAQRAFTPLGEPTSMTELRMDAVAELSVRLFGSESRYAADHAP